jgi:hypothetical protein
MNSRQSFGVPVKFGRVHVLALMPDFGRRITFIAVCSSVTSNATKPSDTHAILFVSRQDG